MRTAKNLPAAFIKLCRSITAKRARTVIDHLLKYGTLTTEELKLKYGYDHAPRAIRDVREQGIPIETFSAKAANGRKIAGYRFGDPASIRVRKSDGRQALTAKLKAELIERYGCRCAIYLETLPPENLQIDHRVPYAVAGEPTTPTADDFMLLSASANRAKSWSCEHCENAVTHKRREICLSCYWARPEDYEHVAMQPIRRLDLQWQGAEGLAQYARLCADAAKEGLEPPAFVKRLIARALT
jgi:hypothetical protein